MGRWLQKYLPKSYVIYPVGAWGDHERLFTFGTPHPPLSRSPCLAAARSRSRSDTTLWCHSLRSRRFATSTVRDRQKIHCIQQICSPNHNETKIVSSRTVEDAGPYIGMRRSFCLCADFLFVITIGVYTIKSCLYKHRDWERQLAAGPSRTPVPTGLWVTDRFCTKF